MENASRMVAETGELFSKRTASAKCHNFVRYYMFSSEAVHHKERYRALAEKDAHVAHGNSVML